MQTVEVQWEVVGGKAWTVGTKIAVKADDGLGGHREWYGALEPTWLVMLQHHSLTTAEKRERTRTLK